MQLFISVLSESSTVTEQKALKIIEFDLYALKTETEKGFSMNCIVF